MRTHPFTDDQIKKEYAAVTAKLGNMEYKVRHILVEKEDEAKDSNNKDPRSKARGGDIGWANRASFAPPFSLAF